MNTGKMTRARAVTRRVSVALASVVAASIALAGCTSEGKPTVDVPSLGEGKLSDDIATQLKDATTAAMDTFGASGAVVGVWAPWSGSWVEGVGTVATGSEKPATTEMTFRAGEITREMTCDSLYGMVADKIVSLDDSISKYVIGVSTLSDITLKHLCESTSGLGAVPATVKAEFLQTPARNWRPRELASFGIGVTATGAPGDKYSSSDTGYLLLGLALEEASGMTAQEYIAHYVTGPLGLAKTELPSVASAVPAPTPYLIGQLPPAIEGGRDCSAPVDVTQRSASFGFTNAGVTTDITDLGTYARAVAANTLGGDDGRFADVRPGFDGAPGWVNAAGGSKILGSLIGQAGSAPGYTTAAYSDPATGLTIAVVMNSSAQPDGAESLALQLAAIVSKAPAASGKSAPEAGLPWTAEQYAGNIAALPVCAVAAPAN